MGMGWNRNVESHSRTSLLRSSLHWNFDDVYHSSRDISISGLCGILLFPGSRRCPNHLGTLSLSSPRSKTIEFVT